MSIPNQNIISLFGAVLYQNSINEDTLTKSLQGFLNLKRGAVVEYIDLSNKYIEDVDFSNVTFLAGNFQNTTFTKCNFTNTKFVQPNFEGGLITKSNLFNSYFSKGIYSNLIFDHSIFPNTHFDNIAFENTTFQNLTLKNAVFNNSSFVGCTVTSLSLDSATVDNFYNSELYFLFDGIKSDLFSILSNFSSEDISDLIDLLTEGKFNGSTYQGEFANLLGSLANIKQLNYIDLGIVPDFYRSGEVWFQLIRVGETPIVSSLSALSVSWLQEYLTL